MRDRHQLSLNEYEVLLQLWLAEDRRLRRVDLAQRLLVTQGGITRLLAVLERAGLVERVPCPDDGRVAYAQLTGAAPVASRRPAGTTWPRSSASSPTGLTRPSWPRSESSSPACAPSPHEVERKVRAPLWAPKVQFG